MKIYTVPEISKLLEVNSETVRRWIRNGRLKATLPSNKTGHQIAISDLEAFLDLNPKYNKKFESHATVYEQFYYSDEENYKAGFKYFSEGVLTSIFIESEKEDNVKREESRLSLITRFQNCLELLDADQESFENELSHLQMSIEYCEKRRKEILEAIKFLEEYKFDDV